MMAKDIVMFTDKAIKHIQHVIEERGGGIGFRLSVKQTGCSGYMYVPEVVDSINEKDIAFSVQQDIKIFIDPECVDIIKGTQVDFAAKALGQTQLVFDNPNAESLCGCGESFNLKKN